MDPTATPREGLFSLQIYALDVALADELLAQVDSKGPGSAARRSYAARGAPAAAVAQDAVRRYTLAFTFLDYPTVLLHAISSHADASGVPGTLRFGGGKSCTIRADDARELAYLAKRVRAAASAPHATRLLFMLPCINCGTAAISFTGACPSPVLHAGGGCSHAP